MPDSPFEQAMKRWDVLRFLRRHGWQARVTTTGEANISDPNPECRDKRFRMFFNIKKHMWLCHNCGRRGGDPLGFVKYVLHCDDVRAVQEITATAAAIAIGDEDAPIERIPHIDDQPEFVMPPEVRKLVLPATARSEPYWDYLTDRHMTPTMVRQYAMGFATRGTYKGRVIIPIQVFGRLRGFVARSIHDGAKRKYLNPDEIKTSRLLFNLDHVMESGSEKVVLVEGVFDALRIPDMAVCTFGKKISGSQFSLLRRAGFKQYIFCYDGDAQLDLQHYAEQVPWYADCFTAEIPRQYDPGNAPMTILSRAIQNPKPWEFLEDPLEGFTL